MKMLTTKWPIVLGLSISGFSALLLIVVGLLFQAFYLPYLSEVQRVGMAFFVAGLVIAASPLACHLYVMTLLHSPKTHYERFLFIGGILLIVEFVICLPWTLLHQYGAISIGVEWLYGVVLCYHVVWFPFALAESGKDGGFLLNSGVGKGYYGIDIVHPCDRTVPNFRNQPALVEERRTMTNPLVIEYLNPT